MLRTYDYDRRPRVVAAARRKLALRQKMLQKLLSRGGTFGVISAYRPGPKHMNKVEHGKLLGDLQRMGYRRWEDLRS